MSGALSLVGNGNDAATSYKGISTSSDFTTDNGNPRAWSDGAWSDYDAVSIS